MAPPVGLSYLYPIVPILCAVSTALLLILIPGFWKTRVFALLSIVAWLVIGNLLVFIGMVSWHGNIHDAPIFADILVAFWNMWFVGAFGSMAAFAKFVWQRLQPRSARQLYDHRRRNNRIDAFIAIALPLLWLPMFLFSCSGRYYITEDIGPGGAIWVDWIGFLIVSLPIMVAAAAMIIFNILALSTHLRLRKMNQPPSSTCANALVRTRKLLLMSLMSLLLSLFSIGYTVGKFLQYHPVSSWGPPQPISENIRWLTVIRYIDRYYIDTMSPETEDVSRTRIIFMPFIGFYVFAWFGFSLEARKSYREIFTFMTGIKLKEPEDFTWTKFLSKIWPRRKDNQYLLPTANPCLDPNKYQAQVPARPEKIHFPNQSDEVIEIKREGSNSPPRRLSYHKPSFVPANPPVDSFFSDGENTQDLSPEETNVDQRRLSIHKPPFVPLVLARAGTPEQVKVPHAPANDALLSEDREGQDIGPEDDNVNQHRLSYHKPPCVPIIPMGTDTLGRVEVSRAPENSEEKEGRDIRPEDDSADQPRLSYQSPPFAPIIPMRTANLGNTYRGLTLPAPPTSALPVPPSTRPPSFPNQGSSL